MRRDRPVDDVFAQDVFIHERSAHDGDASAAKFAFNFPTVVADLLNGSLHARLRLAGLLSLIADLVILPAGDAFAILTSSTCTHCNPPFGRSNNGLGCWVPKARLSRF